MRVAILADFPLHVIPALNLAVPQRHFATWLPPLAEAWARPDGIERCWITFSDLFSEIRELTYWNQRFIILPTAKSGRASSLFRADRARMAGVLERLRPDLVHGWGTEDIYALAAVTSGRPSLVSMQGIQSHGVLRSRSSWRMKFQALLELLVIRRATLLTCESPWACAVLKSRFSRAAIECIDYGVHPDFFQETWRPDPLRPAALFVGRLEPAKGLQDVLAAYRSPQLAASELWIAGSGSLEKYRATSPPNVKWLGRLERGKIIELMRQAWCFVLPTRGDTGPTVVKEARVIGLPVISTRCGGTRDYIRDGRNGFFAAPDDISHLTQCLARLLTDHAYCLERGRDGWEEDRTSFRPELTAQRFNRLYEKMQASSGG